MLEVEAHRFTVSNLTAAAAAAAAELQPVPTADLPSTDRREMALGPDRDIRQVDPQLAPATEEGALLEARVSLGSHVPPTTAQTEQLGQLPATVTEGLPQTWQPAPTGRRLMARQEPELRVRSRVILLLR